MAESPGTVYLLDDDESFVRALARRLSLAGYKVETFTNPVLFLEKNSASEPGCIVLDLEMPEINGLQFQQMLRDRNNSIPIVFLSGKADVPASAKAFKEGALDFLTKPVSSDALLEAIQIAMNRHRDAIRRQAGLKALWEMYCLLTPREQEVCLYVTQGLLNKQIGYEMGTAEATVKKHRGRVMEKLRVESLAGLVGVVGRLREGGFIKS